MGKNKKFLPLLILLLIIGGIWFCWGRPISLAKLLPEENWVRMQMWVCDENSDEWIWEIDPPALEAVLAAIDRTTVDRNDKSKNVGFTRFEVLLYPESGDYPTLIYVTDYGKVSVAPFLDLDHYRYYERGQELYDALAALAEGQAPKDTEK